MQIKIPIEYDLEKISSVEHLVRIVDLIRDHAALDECEKQDLLLCVEWRIREVRDGPATHVGEGEIMIPRFDLPEILARIEEE